MSHGNRTHLNIVPIYEQGAIMILWYCSDFRSESGLTPSTFSQKDNRIDKISGLEFGLIFLGLFLQIAKKGSHIKVVLCYFKAHIEIERKWSTETKRSGPY